MSCRVNFLAKVGRQRPSSARVAADRMLICEAEDGGGADEEDEEEEEEEEEEADDNDDDDDDTAICISCLAPVVKNRSRHESKPV